MALSESKKQEIKKELNSTLYEMLPEGIEGEIGVGKFRTEFHRIWVDGDGWLAGGKSIWVVMEVMGKLIKLKKDIDSYSKKWFVQHTSGGASPLDLNKEEIYGHKEIGFLFLFNETLARHANETQRLNLMPDYYKRMLEDTDTVEGLALIANAGASLEEAGKSFNSLATAAKEGEKSINDLARATKGIDFNDLGKLI